MSDKASEPPQVDKMDGVAPKPDETGASSSQPRKRQAPGDGMTTEPLIKRVRLTDKADKYCWFCHKDGGPLLACDLCPRSFHCKCVALPDVNSMLQWICPECEKVMRAESVETRSRSMSLMQSDSFHLLLRYALERMQSAAADAFHQPVNVEQVPQYKEFIVYPCDLSTIEKNIELKIYGCTEAFLADVKWILHNCIIFNGTHHDLTTSAKTVLKICKHEMTEIEVCPECYRNSCAKQKDVDWFCIPCRNPHPLVWAKLKGYPFWPAKALREQDEQVDVRFFGAHDRAWVPVSQVYYLSQECPAPAKGRKAGFDDAMRELELHVRKLREKIGRYDYSPFKTPYKAVTGAAAESAAAAPAATPTGQRSQLPSRKRPLIPKSESSEPSDRSRPAQSSAQTSARTSATATGRATSPPRPPRPFTAGAAVACATSPRSSRTPRLASKHHLFIRHPLGGDADASVGAGDTSSDNGCSASISSLSSASQVSLISPPTDTGSPNDGHVSTSTPQQETPGTPALAAAKLDQPEADDGGACSSVVKMEQEDDEQEGLCDETADRAPALCATAARPAAASSSPSGRGDDGRERSRTPEMPKLTQFSEEKGVGQPCAFHAAGSSSTALQSESPAGALSDDRGDDDCPALAGTLLSNATTLGNTDDGSHGLDIGQPGLDIGQPGQATGTAVGSQHVISADVSVPPTTPTTTDTGVVRADDNKKGLDKDVESAAVDRSTVQSSVPDASSDANGVPPSDAFFENLAQTIETCKAQLGLFDAQPCDQADDGSDSDDDRQSSGSGSSMDSSPNELCGSGSSAGQAASRSRDGNSDSASGGTRICNVCSKRASTAGGAGTIASYGDVCRICGTSGGMPVPPGCISDATANAFVPADRQSSNAKTSGMPIDNGTASDRVGVSSGADEPLAAALRAESGADEVAAGQGRLSIRSRKSLVKVLRDLQGEGSPAVAASSVVSAVTASATSDELAVITGSSSKPSHSASAVATKNHAGILMQPATKLGDCERDKPAVHTLASQTAPLVEPKEPESAANSSTAPGQPVPVCAEHAADVAGTSASDVASGESKCRDASTQATVDEVEELRKWVKNELTEIKHNQDVLVNEIKKMNDVEKQRLLSKTKKQADERFNQAVEEAKSKQWCANCHREAQFYCCWNTSYCDYPCQQLHWSQHMLTCNQITPEALASAGIITTTEDDSDGGAATETTQPAAAAPVAMQQPSASTSKPAAVAGVVSQQHGASSPVSLLQQQHATTRRPSPSHNGDFIAQPKQARSAVAVTQHVTEDQRVPHSRTVTFTISDRLQRQPTGPAVAAAVASAATAPSSTMYAGSTPTSVTSNAAGVRRPSATTVLVVDGNSNFAALRQQPSAGAVATPGRSGNPAVGAAVGATTAWYQQLATTGLQATGVGRSSNTSTSNGGGTLLTGGVPRQQPTSAAGSPATVAVVRSRSASSVSGLVLRQQPSAAAGARSSTIPAPFFRSPASAQSGAGQSRSSTHMGSSGQQVTRRSAQ